MSPTTIISSDQYAEDMIRSGSPAKSLLPNNSEMGDWWDMALVDCLPDTPPPTMPPSPTTSPEQYKQQLCRYLIEILAFTFKVDPKELRRATNPGSKAPHLNSETPFILTRTERDQLLHLSCTVQHVHAKVCRNEVLTTYRRDRDLINDAILRPAHKLGIYPLHALDLISTYKDHQCNPDKRRYTILAVFTPRFCKCISYRFESTLNAHRLVMERVSRNDDVQHVLGRAFEKVWRRYYTPEYVPCGVGPVRKGMHEVMVACQRR
jgi:hypothetical protein